MDDHGRDEAVFGIEERSAVEMFMTVEDETTSDDRFPTNFACDREMML